MARLRVSGPLSHPSPPSTSLLLRYRRQLQVFALVLLLIAGTRNTLDFDSIIESSTEDAESSNQSREGTTSSNAMAVMDEEGTNIYDGIIGSPDSTMINFNGCTCELVSVDCLDSVKCVLALSENQQLDAVYQGVLKRRALQGMARYWQKVQFMPAPGWAPIGKSMQFVTTALWREWLKRNRFPKALINMKEDVVNSTAYPYCVKHSLKGKACFIDNFDEPEEMGDLEKQALEKFGVHNEKLYRDLQKQLKNFQSHPLRSNPYEYLSNYCHVSRIGFHLRRHVLDIYDRRLKTINAQDSNKPVLKVSLHLRRGDACDHKLDGYEKNPSKLDSKAQLSGNTRVCYHTSVYLNALQHIQSLAPSHHLEVYVATDHMDSLLDEIKQQFSDVYQRMTWKYVDYARQLFNYSTGMTPGGWYIEFTDKHGALGETAVADVWHLSHGQVFVGHLGSRFGKLSWWQATARHNAFVPFFSVDGHSVCCDIDEGCGKLAPAIVSMENCLSFSREHRPDLKVDSTRYWIEGATVRFMFAAEEIKFRQEQNVSYEGPPRYADYIRRKKGFLGSRW
jgi:hypothetical protein